MTSARHAGKPPAHLAPGNHPRRASEADRRASPAAGRPVGSGALRGQRNAHRGRRYLVHQGEPIRRPAMVRLFSSVLRREPDGRHVLVTPAEKLDIDVDRTAFRAISMSVEGRDREQRIAFQLDSGEAVILGPEHPLRVRGDQTGPSPADPGRTRLERARQCRRMPARFHLQGCCRVLDGPGKAAATPRLAVGGPDEAYNWHSWARKISRSLLQGVSGRGGLDQALLSFGRRFWPHVQRLFRPDDRRFEASKADTLEQQAFQARFGTEKPVAWAGRPGNRRRKGVLANHRSTETAPCPRGKNEKDFSK